MQKRVISNPRKDCDIMCKFQLLVITVNAVLTAVMVGGTPFGPFVDPADVNAACLQPKTEGPCYALFPRYFYNTQTALCDKFNYGGCWGNDNNFETIEMCQKTCMGGK